MLMAGDSWGPDPGLRSSSSSLSAMGFRARPSSCSTLPGESVPCERELGPLDLDRERALDLEVEPEADG